MRGWGLCCHGDLAALSSELAYSAWGNGGFFFFSSLNRPSPCLFSFVPYLNYHILGREFYDRHSAKGFTYVFSCMLTTLEQGSFINHI